MTQKVLVAFFSASGAKHVENKLPKPFWGHFGVKKTNF